MSENDNGSAAREVLICELMDLLEGTHPAPHLRIGAILSEVAIILGGEGKRPMYRNIAIGCAAFDALVAMGHATPGHHPTRPLIAVRKGE